MNKLQQWLWLPFGWKFYRFGDNTLWLKGRSVHDFPDIIQLLTDRELDKRYSERAIFHLEIHIR